MSLPASCSSAGEYFAASVRLLQRYRRLYNFPNTDVLLTRALDEIPLDGLEQADIFADDFRLELVHNRFLNEFCDRVRELSVSYDGGGRQPEPAPAPGGPPLGPKKKHEIVHLAQEMRELCERVDCHTVVDFGSGLGYLDQRLFETGGYRVLGVESDAARHLAARRRQRAYHEDSRPHVRFMKHTITEESGEHIARALEAAFGAGAGARWCACGLHACADLAVHALRVFLSAAGARCLLALPCCYHKMRHQRGRFDNFPLSASLRGEFSRARAHEFLSVAALRLAAQPRRPRGPGRRGDGGAGRGLPLPHLVFHLLARAALQLYAHTHNCSIKRNKRKPVRAASTENDFETYMRTACDGFTLTSNEPNAHGDTVHFDLDELRAVWRQITTSPTYKKAGILIILQNYLQDVIENLILFDRLMFLRENGIEKCYYKKILNDEISPRALALIAYKY